VSALIFRGYFITCWTEHKSPVKVDAVAIDEPFFYDLQCSFVAGLRHLSVWKLIVLETCPNSRALRQIYRRTRRMYAKRRLSKAL
jgi:hypothetical protein